MLLENKRLRREEIRVFGEDLLRHRSEVVSEPVVDALVDRAEVIGEEGELLPEVGDQPMSDLKKRIVLRITDNLEAAGIELEIDVVEEVFRRRIARVIGSVEADGPCFEVFRHATGVV